MEAERDALPKVYVADLLAAYNVGVLHGEWIELTPETTVDDVRDSIQLMLDQSPVLPDEVAEEYAIHDYEGFYGHTINEYEDLKALTEMGSFVAEHGQLGALLLRHSSDIDEAKRALDEQYAGAAESLSDWASDHLEETGELEHIPERWRAYLDLERYADDLELGGDIFTINTGDGMTHVFWTR
jgi:antirestriction protein